VSTVTSSDESRHSLDNAVGIVTEVRAGGGRIVAAGGCFDLLHRGHVALLQHAGSLGDCLVVCINDDESVWRRKGGLRPVVPAGDRAEILLALACVDAVVIFGEDSASRTLDAIRPDIFVKGDDYKLEEITERETVERNGGIVNVVARVPGLSTTSLLARLARSAEGGRA
jgi:D-beta-D-heptose 7-phosphate kinase/D-beta-D-heptose 1-phosphate adenosyltransferase